ncbi:MAG: class I SAM-dependent methyltransferase [Pyrinomonadaceae bacterium]
MQSVQELFGNIDIYLFDQILKDRFLRNQKILDAGCGSGRNLMYFIRKNFDVYAIDKDLDSVVSLKQLAQSINPKLSSMNFQRASIENLPFAEETFDWVISSAVLHFAENEERFDAMLNEM